MGTKASSYCQRCSFFQLSTDEKLDGPSTRQSAGHRSHMITEQLCTLPQSILRDGSASDLCTHMASYLDGRADICICGLHGELRKSCLFFAT